MTMIMVMVMAMMIKYVDILAKWKMQGHHQGLMILEMILVLVMMIMIDDMLKKVDSVK